MLPRPLVRFAIRTFALGLATLAIAPAADASLVYTIQRYTDNTYSTAFGGYQVTSTTASADDLIIFNFTAGNTIAVGKSGLLTPTVLNAANFGLSNAQASRLTIQASGESSEGPNQSYAQDNETDFESSITGPLYFQVTVSQDLYALPNTNPLALTIDLSENQNNDGMSQFKGKLTTDGGANSGELGFVTGGPTLQVLGPLYVTNTSQGSFTLLTTMRVVLDASGNSGLNQRIVATGNANVFATPEPATLAMALAALPVLGIGAWRRRKAQS